MIDRVNEFAMKRAEFLTRRHFLRQAGALGIGSIALAELLAKPQSAEAAASTNPLTPRIPHYPGTAKRVIFLHLSGGPPHLDLFDYKPDLVKHNDEPCPDSLLAGKRFAFTSGVPKLLGTPQTFRQHGRSGVRMSDVVPHLAGIADELTFIKS